MAEPVTPPESTPSTTPTVTEQKYPPAWQARVGAFALAVGKSINEVTAALADIVGEPGDEALSLLSDARQATPEAALRDALASLKIPTAKLNVHLEKLRGAPTAPTPASVSTVSQAPEAEIPEGQKPSTAQVNSFATSLGMDPSTLAMFMMAGASGSAGMGGGLDISSMIPVPQIVAGYNPKIRNLYLMVMGTMEERLGTNIVVINSDGSINRDLTVEYITGLEEGRDPAENNVYFGPDGQPFEVIAVGVDAQSIYDADPLDSTRALQQNLMGIGRVNWRDVSLEVRQVAYYAASRTHEIDPANDAHLSWLRDHVKPTATRLVFSGQAPKALTEFNEARRTGTLPTLRVMLTRGPRRKEFMPRRRSGTPRDLAGLGRSAPDQNNL